MLSDTRMNFHSALLKKKSRTGNRTGKNKNEYTKSQYSMHGFNAVVRSKITFVAGRKNTKIFTRKRKPQRLHIVRKAQIWQISRSSVCANGVDASNNS